MTRELELPQSFCASICRNSMNDLCVEKCAPRRDMSQFDPQKGDIEDYPRFPIEDYLHTMTPDEREIMMAVYVAKIVDFVQGRKDMNADKSAATRRVFQSPTYETLASNAASKYFQEPDVLTSRNSDTSSHSRAEEQAGSTL